jgi:DNA-3-methyladenine glycosylase I
MAVDGSGVVRGPDGVRRCFWGASTPEYVAYHDDEWGRPVVDDVRLFEKISLEGFQSGLSWLTILRKREGFRKAFAGFDPSRVARFGERDIARLLGDAAIIRHRGKIEATIANARATLAVQEERGSLATLLWSYEVRRRTAPRVIADIPSSSPESIALAKELKSFGFRFVGPTTAYAAMQAMGVVNDHLVGCAARGACTRARRELVIP